MEEGTGHYTFLSIINLKGSAFATEVMRLRGTGAVELGPRVQAGPKCGLGIILSLA